MGIIGAGTPELGPSRPPNDGPGANLNYLNSTDGTRLLPIPKASEPFLAMSFLNEVVMLRRTFIPILLVGLVVSPVFMRSAAGQTWKEPVGYNALLAEKGAALEDGSGILVGIVEAPSGSASGPYLPNVNSSEFAGKTITDMTGTNSNASGHATGVGIRFFGKNQSMAGGVTQIGAYEANDYVFRVIGALSGTDPLADSYDVTNHSYVGSGLSTSQANDLLMRFDYVINRDNTVAVVGTNNGSGNRTPQLLAPSYNAITVGRSDGNHARGGTVDYGVGRLKPDIVAPLSFTSDATPVVASAATLLKHAGAGTGAAQNEVIRALLFAGATKEEFVDWDRTTTRPIDDIYGFGELNIYNSYHILEGGEFEASTSDPASTIGLEGYDYGQFNGSDALFYDFEIANEATLSAALTWNAEITDNDASGLFDPSFFLANLDLELFDSSGTFLGTLVDSSLSTLYNQEHIYQTNLAAGSYTFRISGSGATDFGFAWRIAPVPEPSGLCVGLLGLGLWVRRRRRPSVNRPT